jgi:hypothetical protein
MTTYELKDQTTGFFDPETGLKIVRDGRATPDRIGAATAVAIKAGRLIAVSTTPRRKPRTDQTEAKSDEGAE